MKRYIYSIILGALTLSACDKGPQLTVGGTIEGAADSVLYLAHCSLDGIHNVDSVTLAGNGSFTLRAAAPSGCPDFYVLRSGRHIINLTADSSETITVRAKLASMERDYEVEGNEGCKLLKEICQKRQQLQARLVKIEKNEDMYPGDMIDSVNNLIAAYKEDMKQSYIYSKPSSAAAYFAVCQDITDLRGTFKLFNPLSERTDVKCYATVATAWDAAYPEADRTEQLCNMAIKGMNNTAAPQQSVLEVDEDKVAETGIIDITLPDVNSKMRSVSELKGKVVMIDFTLFGAQQSAQRTRLMRSLYEKYHSRGLEIYQISLDEDVHFWKFSCDNLPWICVHETDGSASRIYNVNALPTFFLVNRDNEIVTRSDFMEGSLEENILKLL